MTSRNRVFLHKELTAEIIAAFYTVYNALGYGFLEAVYVNALCIELSARNLRVRREVPVEVQYLGQAVGFYRADIIVEGVILVEIKAAVTTGESDNRQVLNYLRATNLPVGLLLHFGPKPVHKRFVWTEKQLNSRA